MEIHRALGIRKAACHAARLAALQDDFFGRKLGGGSGEIEVE